MGEGTPPAAFTFAAGASFDGELKSMMVPVKRSLL
jgi:hypothetical protein